MTAANIVPFESGNLPAYLRQYADRVDNSAAGPGSSGFPVMSLKGKRFTLVRSGVRQIINDPRTDEPANSIIVAILRINPGTSKAFYMEGFVEGENGKPDCFSSDGIRPDPSSTNKQAKTCAACPHNAFGSASTGRGKACPDTKRMAVAQIDRLDDPILLRVPPTSIKNLGNYGAFLASKGVDMRWMATQIGFDPEVTHQLLTFQQRGILDSDSVQHIMDYPNEDLLRQITGERQPVVQEEEAPAPAPARPKLQTVKPAPAPAFEEDDEDELPAPTPAPKAKAKAKPAPAPVIEEDDEDDEDEPPAPVAKPKARVKVQQDIPASTGSLSDDIGAFLEAPFED